MMTSLRSKWAAGKAVRAGLAVRGRISRAIRSRRATQPPAHFHRNPQGRGRLAVFPRCSLLTYRSRYDRRYRQSGSDRLEKQPTALRRKACLFRGQDSSRKFRFSEFGIWAENRCSEVPGRKRRSSEEISPEPGLRRGKRLQNDPNAVPRPITV